MYKTASEIESALAVTYDGPTKEKDGFTYIPATESRRALDRIFGTLGWSQSTPQYSIDPSSGVYAATLTLTGRFVDETGEVRDVSRTGFGRSTAQATRAEREQGLTVTQNLQLHDTAVAAAGTDAFSRACKMFGPALGSDLYDGNPTPSARSGASSTARPTAAPGARKGPSDAQRGVLGRLGYSDEAIDAMPYATWKGYVDTYFNNRNKKASDSDEPLPF